MKGIACTARSASFTPALLALVLPGTAAAGSAFDWGNFSAPSVTGLYTVSHNLGVAPKMIMMMISDANTNDTTKAGDNMIGLCFTDLTSYGGVQYTTADLKVTDVQCPYSWGGAKGTIQSSSTTNFVINYASLGNTYLHRYLAIGGTDISAKVVGWTIPTTTGNKTVSGVGFKPNVVLHIHALADSTVVNTEYLNPGGFGIGAMDADGDQWANMIYSNSTGPNTDTSRYQRLTKTLVVGDGSSVKAEAQWVSMNADGFTVNFTTAPATAGGLVYSLALKGLEVKAGSFNKATTTGNQTVTYSEFAPKALLFSSVGNSSSATVQPHAGWMIGGTDETRSGSWTMWEVDNVSTASYDATDQITASHSMIIQEDNDTTMDSVANYSSSNSTSFTENWTTSTGQATEIVYLALGSLPASAITLDSLEAQEDPRGVCLQWRTGRELDNLGFHVYREEKSGERIRITPGLVAGSGLFTAGAAPLAGARSYRWCDGRPPGAATRYWLEDVDIHGTTRWHETTVRATAAGEMGGATLSASPLLVADSSTNPARSEQLSVIAEQTFLESKEDRSVRTKVQLSLAARPAVKLSVRTPGWYRVRQRELARAGADAFLAAATDPRQLRLYVDGEEQPIRVAGGDDGRFDPDDAVEFYGTGADTSWTDSRVYWLVVDDRAGKRLGLAPTAEPSARSSEFATGSIFRERKTYFAALKNGTASNFFGAVIAGKPVAATIAVPALARSDGASLEVSLQGVTNTRHQVSAWLGETRLDLLTFDGMAAARQRFPIPPGLVVEGDNVVRLVPEGGDRDVTLVESLRLNYLRRYEADNQALLFEASAGTVLTVTGFSGPQIRLFDVTEPARASEVVATVARDGEAFSISATAPHGRGLRRLLAVAESGILTPARIEVNQPSSWHREPWNEKTLLALGPKSLLDELGPLTTARAAQGWKVALVDIDDVYDELSFGAKDPRAIRDFLALPRQQDRTPVAAVLLVGDASFDPRNYLGLGDFDTLSTWLVDTDELETSSDDWFVDFDDDRHPDVPIGRLPARTPANVATMVSKIVGQSPVALTHHRPGAGPGVALIADADRRFDFEGQTARMHAVIPPLFRTSDILRREVGDAAMKSAVATAMHDGTIFAHYTGHGSVERWAGDVLTSTDAGSITGARAPVVMSMTCLTGFFQDVYTNSLAEALVSSGGASAVFASSGTPGQGRQEEQFDRELVRQILAEGTPLGEALQKAKAQLAPQDADALRTWMLFGDPTMALTETEPDNRPAKTGGCALATGASHIPFAIPLGAVAVGLFFAAISPRRRTARPTAATPTPPAPRTVATPSR